MSREVREGRQAQSANEKIAYTLTTTPWASTPTVTALSAYDITGPRQYDPVTSTVFPTGSSSVAGDVITLPLLQALTAGHVYRVVVQFTSGGNTFEAYFDVQAER